MYMKRNYVPPLAVEAVVVTETVIAASAPEQRLNPGTQTGTREEKSTTWGSLWN